MPKKSLYPKFPLEKSLDIATTIYQKNGGNPMRRLTIFNELGKSPDSGQSRLLITASNNYGLTKGGYTAEKIEVLERGKRVIEKDPASIIESIMGIDLFASFFNQYENSTLPTENAAKDFLILNGVESDDSKQCLRIILENGRYANLIQELSGTERVVSIEAALDKFPDLSEKVIMQESLQKPQKPEPTTRLEKMPNLHIDIQIHIDSSASAEQIEKVFESMAKHLYNN